MEKKVTKKITTSQVDYWLGNSGYRKQIEDAFEVIAEVANGKYDPKLLREEILGLQD